MAWRDFAKRFERGKLSFTGNGSRTSHPNRRCEQKAKYGFTGDVLQVISVFGRQQKFAKLLKRLTVGA
jgi:hypothetical protein